MNIENHIVRGPTETELSLLDRKNERTVSFALQSLSFEKPNATPVLLRQGSFYYFDES
jgi:hypothetical protein